MSRSIANPKVVVDCTEMTVAQVASHAKDAFQNI